MGRASSSTTYWDWLAEFTDKPKYRLYPLLPFLLSLPTSQKCPLELWQLLMPRSEFRQGIFSMRGANFDSILVLSSCQIKQPPPPSPHILQFSKCTCQKQTKQEHTDIYIKFVYVVCVFVSKVMAGNIPLAIDTFIQLARLVIFNNV